MTSEASKLSPSVGTQIAWYNALRRAVPWGVLGGLFAILYTSDAHWTRYILAFALCHFVGILPTPPLFKFAYKIYCSESVGYKLIRPRLHPRFPASHAEYFPAVRSLRKGNTLVCESQKKLSEEIRKFAETAKNSAEEGDVLILPIPVLSDNYAYAIIYPSAAQKSTESATLNCALIDATDPHRIFLELERQLILAGSAEAGTVEVYPDDANHGSISTIVVGEAMAIKLNITHVLTTHKHWDHAGGNKEIEEIAHRFSEATSKGTTFDIMEPAMRTELVEKVNKVESDRRKSERQKQRILRQNIPREKLPLDPKTLQPMIPEESEDSDAEVSTVAAGIKVPPKRTQKPKKDKNQFVHFMAESDAQKARGLITFEPNIPFVGSKIDNPHCTNTFVSNLDKVSLGDVATVTVLDAPGHTCGSVMFLVTLAERAEQSIFDNEVSVAVSSTEGKKSDQPHQMSHSVNRALFTGDCIFCGGCGAMFETKSAEETLRTYDCFTGSTLTAHPLKQKQGTSIDAGPSFYVSSKNILLFVGHEYTDRLFSELVGMVKKAKDKLIEESEAKAKKEANERQLRGEPPGERKDISTAALDEILEKNNKDAKKKDPLAKPVKTLPIRAHHAAIDARWEQICEMRAKYHSKAATVPTSLYDERRTNPLLTLERSVLTKLVALNAHASVIEQEVYGSDIRRSQL